MFVEQFPAFVERNPEADIPLPGVKGWLLQGTGQQNVYAGYKALIVFAEPNRYHPRVPQSTPEAD